MASSTTNPVEIVSAIRVRLLMLKSNMYIAANVPIRASGTAMPAMKVAAKVRKKTKMTPTTRPMVSSNSNLTSATDARMVLVRSVRMVMEIDGGSDRLNFGNCALMLSTTWMMFAPGCRWMLTMMAGTLFIQAASWLFSMSSFTSATSESRIGAPLR
jgi:hypothetical protein